MREGERPNVPSTTLTLGGPKIRLITRVSKLACGQQTLKHLGAALENNNVFKSEVRNVRSCYWLTGVN